MAAQFHREGVYQSLVVRLRDPGSLADFTREVTATPGGHETRCTPWSRRARARSAPSGPSASRVSRFSCPSSSSRRSSRSRGGARVCVMALPANGLAHRHRRPQLCRAGLRLPDHVGVGLIRARVRGGHGRVRRPASFAAGRPASHRQRPAPSVTPDHGIRGDGRRTGRAYRPVLPETCAKSASYGRRRG
jgi:hypothetical protein